MILQPRAVDHEVRPDVVGMPQFASKV